MTTISHKTPTYSSLQRRLVAKINSSPQPPFKTLLPRVLVPRARFSVPKARKILIPRPSRATQLLLCHKTLLPRLLFLTTLSKRSSTVACLPSLTRQCKTLVPGVCPPTNKSPQRYGLGLPLNHKIHPFLRMGRPISLHVLHSAPTRDNGGSSNVTPTYKLPAE
jgi:hypothetical protein